MEWRWQLVQKRRSRFKRPALQPATSVYLRTAPKLCQPNGLQGLQTVLHMVCLLLTACCCHYLAAALPRRLRLPPALQTGGQRWAAAEGPAYQPQRQALEHGPAVLQYLQAGR